MSSLELNSINILTTIATNLVICRDWELKVNPGLLIERYGFLDINGER